MTSSQHQEDHSQDLSEAARLFAARERENPVWVDLPSPDRAQLEEVRQALGFSPAVITHCLVPTHTPTVVPIDSSLFLVTFLGTCVSQGLFVLRVLKVYVAPDFFLTVHGCSRAAFGVRPFRLPELPSASGGRTGHLLRLILEGAVQSYERLGAELLKCLRGGTQSDPGQLPIEQISRQQVRRKGQQLVRFLRQQRVFLHEVARLGGPLFDADDRNRLQWLVERVGVLTRRVGEMVRIPLEEDRLKTQTLKVIMTAAEKRTVLIGGWFACRRFMEVDLRGAVFRQADLAGAKFQRSDLYGADFQQANLQGAVFSFCNLQQADFTDACLEGANFLTSFGLSPAMWGYIRSRGGVV